MTKGKLVLSVISFGLMSNLIVSHAVRELSQTSTLIICVALSLLSVVILVQIISLIGTDRILKLSLVLASIYSIGLMSVSYLHNSKKIDPSATQGFELFLIAVFLAALCSGGVSYLLRDL
jgi:O-antigen ligase